MDSRPCRRTRQETRALLEYLITLGTRTDLTKADPAWLSAPPSDEGSWNWYAEFGDSTSVRLGREQLLSMVIDLHKSSRAPAARALNVESWFDEWVELPQSALGFKTPAEVLCTCAGLEASKVIVRSLQNRARR